MKLQIVVVGLVTGEMTDPPVNFVTREVTVLVVTHDFFALLTPDLREEALHCRTVRAWVVTRAVQKLLVLNVPRTHFVAVGL
jgi:hypothetical protein